MKLLQLLQSEFSISPESPTGLLRNGKPTGWNNGRYWRTKIKGRAMMCHVIIMILYTKDEELGGLEVDHIDRDGFNNKLENLRLVSRSENVLNTKCRSDSKTGVKVCVLDKAGLSHIQPINRETEIGLVNHLELYRKLKSGTLKKSK